MMPIISFVIPVYNNEKYVLNAVNSIIKQINDYDVEIVVVDDGSTDATGRILDERYGDKSNIRIIHQPNTWVYGAMNRGINEARGEYIYILNSDDRLLDYAVKLLLLKIEEHNHPDVIYTRTMIAQVDDNQRIMGILNGKEYICKEECYEKKELIKRWVEIDSKSLMDTANLFKRELMIKHPFTNKYFCADNYFNIEIISDIGSAVLLPQIIYEHFIYASPDRNVSKGKYYDYAHDAYDELLKRKLDFINKWDLGSDDVDYVIKQRLRLLTSQIKSLNYYNCALTLSEKVERIVNEYTSGIISIAVKDTKFNREYESRLLNGLADLLKESTEELDDKYGFVYQLVKYLPKNHLENISLSKTEMMAVEKAISNNNNKRRLGDIYYHTNW